jgi:Ca2+-binding EF-hand superfamily protein
MIKAAGMAFAGIFAVLGAAGAIAAVGDGEGVRSAQPATQRGGQGLKRFDADRDQAVSVDEFLKRRVEAFTKRDKNGDGVLDPAELGQAPLGFRQQRQEQRLEGLHVRLDGNADGKLTRAEFDADRSETNRRGSRSERTAERRQLLFSFYDRNGNGVVEKAEYEAGRAEEIEFGKRKRLHALDRNGDGKVTLEEYTADARFRFLRLDLDRDGRITAADLPPFERQIWSAR